MLPTAPNSINVNESILCNNCLDSYVREI